MLRVEMRVVLRLKVGVIAGLLVLIVAGCTDDRERPSATLPPLSSTTSAEPTEDLPGPPGYPFPPEALEYTEAGAIAFFNYWIELLNETLATLGGEPIRLLSTEDCAGCLNRMELYERDLPAGYSYSGGSIPATSPIQPVLVPNESGESTAGIAVAAMSEELMILDNNAVRIPGRGSAAIEIFLSLDATFLLDGPTRRVTSFTQGAVN